MKINYMNHYHFMQKSFPILCVLLQFSLNQSSFLGSFLNIHTHFCLFINNSFHHTLNINYFNNIDANFANEDIYMVINIHQRCKL